MIQIAQKKSPRTSPCQMYTIPKLQLSQQGRQKIEAFFNGGRIASDAMVLLSKVDKRTQLTAKATKTLTDRRHSPMYCAYLPKSITPTCLRFNMGV
jgi:hypothetical protein